MATRQTLPDEKKGILMAAHDANDKSNPLEKPSNDLDLFDHIQDEFDALLSGTELPEVEDIQAVEQNTLTDLVLQDTTELLSTTDMQAFDMATDKSADDPESPEESNANDMDVSQAPENNASDDIPKETPVHEPENSDATDLENINKVFLSESDLSDADDTGEKAALPPVQDKHQSDLDGIDPFSDEMDDVALQEKAPVHPDMSEDQATQRQSGGRMMMFAGIFVLIVAGGIYWFVSGPQEPADQLASGQEKNISNTTDKQQGLSDSTSVASVETQEPQENIQTEVTTLKKKDSVKKVTAQPAETEKEPIQRAAVEKAKAERLPAKQAAEKRAAAKKAKAERLAAKQAAEKRAAAKKAKAERLAAKQAAVKEVAVIQPSTQLQKLPLKSQTPAAVADESGNWVIKLASVNSDKAAKQHMARIRSMGVESESVKINDKGRVFHSIRITGFTSKLEAMKRRDALAKRLGVRGAKIEKL